MLPSRACRPALRSRQRPRPNVVLENIAQHSWKPSIASFPTLAERGAGVEQFRSLRSRVYQARYEAPLKTILVSSGMPSEGQELCRGESGHEPGAQQCQ
jgi:hypothetical protein